jgi:hypothetical protein
MRAEYHRVRAGSQQCGQDIRGEGMISWGLWQDIRGEGRISGMMAGCQGRGHDMKG